MSEKVRLASRIGNLERRARLNRAIRQFFDERGFVEIEAPILVPSPGLELHLDAFEVAGAGYLITSPEYQMKRLLAGGMKRIYSLGKVFRRGERGRHHNPEFTMLEWYRADAEWTVIADDTEQLIRHCAQAIDSPLNDYLAASWERSSVREVFRRYAKVALVGDESVEALREKLSAAGHRLPDGGDWSALFFQVFLDVIERRIGRNRPTLLYDWPAPLCALARPKPGNAAVVERFEVYAGGIELCNAFGELTDATEQRRRLQADLAERRARALPQYPVDERFLSAVAEMPPAAGIALGVDRLAMLLMEVTEIQSVLPFSSEEL